MDFILIVFASVTTANRVKNELMKKYSVKSVVIHTPSALGLKECGYSLKLKRKYLDTAWNLVSDYALMSKGVYSAEDFTKLK